jgi:multidrug efflux system membrane fusion protein
MQPDHQVQTEADVLAHKPPRHLKAIGAGALCLAAVAIGAGVVSRVSANQSTASWTDARAVPIVRVLSLKGVGAGTLVLPGDVQAYHSAPIHARVSGYLKSWNADIGALVKAGQTIALIDTPDLDQQLAQAKADLATAVANQHLADTTARRWAQLLSKDAVSHQDAEAKDGDLEAKTALVASAKANVDRLEALESFKRITAPFDGVVTTRATDIGALINVGGASDVPLFTVADERKLRIYVRVPQSYSAAVKPGMTASFTVPEYPGRTFTAALATTAHAVTPQTGTLLIELQIDNADGALKPGDYAQVKFDLPSDGDAIRAPASALMFRDSGMQVAVLGPNDRVMIKSITINRDLGQTVEIASGVSRNDRVIDNPPDSLRAGDRVKIAPAGGPGGEAHAQR